MTPENFTYWLKGYFEISKSRELSPEQVEEIKNHLDLVFEKVTPYVEIYSQLGIKKPLPSLAEVRYC
jgi:hypothetical protein